MSRMSHGSRVACLSCTDCAHFCAAGGYRPFGIDGWRIVFLTVGVASFLLGILNYFFAHDPRYARDNKSVLQEHQHGMSFWGALGEMKKIVAIPSFLIIILQVSLAGNTMAPLRAHAKLVWQPSHWSLRAQCLLRYGPIGEGLHDLTAVVLALVPAGDS